jgi:hypothetical protein
VPLGGRNPVFQAGASHAGCSPITPVQFAIKTPRSLRTKKMTYQRLLHVSWQGGAAAALFREGNFAIEYSFPKDECSLHKYLSLNREENIM